ncbi:MAG: flagellin, partial [Planctomycetota bacterium]
AESRGTGGVVSVNGQELFTDGLSAEAATADFNGHIVFREGELAQTTIAQVGYDRSASSTAIGQMMLVNNLAVNAGTNNREDITNFTNGMQFQLGEGDGDQERTVYSIQSMAVANLGKVKFTDDFNGDGQQTEKTLTLSDLLGGGFGSLAVDPVKALTVIDAAINDVSGLRARIGSFQANMLQTNANSLGVAIENITATESDIRDANMAAETTDFTKNQILVQAGTAMLAQANATSQNVLQLLG